MWSDEGLFAAQSLELLSEARIRSALGRGLALKGPYHRRATLAAQWHIAALGHAPAHPLASVKRRAPHRPPPQSTEPWKRRGAQRRAPSIALCRQVLETDREVSLRLGPLAVDDGRAHAQDARHLGDREPAEVAQLGDLGVTGVRLR